MEKLCGKSMDLTEENLNSLKQLFPEVFTEGKIDFEKLRLVLGDEVDDKEERYEFTWHGKSNAIRIAQTPSTGTLIPDKEGSKNWDNTENLYIEGDNLEVLKLLLKSYFDKLDLIFIDPPYNTGTDIIYKNNFADPIKYYKFITGQVSDDGKSIKTNTESNGRYHTDWVNMMYSRLKISRNLLKREGIFCISIDHNEVFNLGKICDEVFGEDNRIAIISVVHKPEGRNQAKFIGPSNEYLFVYAKNISYVKLQRVVLDEELAKQFEFEDDNGSYKLKNFIRLSDGKYSLRQSKPAFWYPIYVSNDLKNLSLDYFEGSSAVYPITIQGIERTWKTTKDTFIERYNKGNIIAKRENDNIIIYEKLRQDEVIKTHWVNKKYHGFHFGTKVLDDLLKVKTFDFPKSLYLMKDIIKLFCNKNGLILDFFSGSATTCHAAMELNVEDNGNRKFIAVQLPEKIDEKSEAYKAGYKNICEIGKERIRRAGNKIVSENKDKEGIENLDIGFKVFKLDSSNLKSWDSSMDNLEQNLLDMESNLKKDRTNEDLLYEILLKSGVELTAKIEEIKVGYNTLYNIGQGALLACLDDKITQDVIDEIPKHKSPFMDTKVIFKEAGFMSDAAKINAVQNLKQFKIEDVRSV